MKTKDIENIIENFIVSESSAILLDGAWGIGKTYAIQQLLLEDRYKKEIYDNCNMHYISLFGFKDIDVLHKELYVKFNPKKAKALKALSYVSLAVSFNNIGIGINTSNIRQDIEDNQSKKQLNKNDYKNIIIFDDIERIAANENELIELLGYFNRLINDGIKIISICNSAEIKKNNKEVFDNFKEKIFDRIYEINENNLEVIEKIFGNEYYLLTKEDITFFEQNLRFVKKTKIFIDEITRILSIKQNLSATEKRKICTMCILVVKEVFTKKFSEELYIRKKERLEDDSYQGKFFATYTLEKYGTDEFVLQALDEELQKYGIIKENEMLHGLYNYFKYNDLSCFDSERIKPKKLLQTSLFFLNDEVRKKHIEEVLDEFYLNSSNYTADEILGFLRDLLIYNNGILCEDDYNKIIKVIIKMEEKKLLSISDGINRACYFRHNQEQEKFANLLNNEILRKDTSDIIKKFQNLNVNCYDGFILEIIRKYQGQMKSLSTKVFKLLEENKYYLPDLSDNISSSSWNYCHDICSLMLRLNPDKISNFYSVLDEQAIKNPSSKCLKERLEALKAKQQ